MKEWGRFPLVTSCPWRSGSGLRICCSPTVLTRSLWSCYSLCWAQTELIQVCISPNWLFRWGWGGVCPLPLPREVIPPLAWVLPVFSLRRERYSVAAGCCAPLLIEMKHHYNSYFLFSTFCMLGPVLGFMISILQLMKLIVEILVDVLKALWLASVWAGRQCHVHTDLWNSYFPHTTF